MPPKFLFEIADLDLSKIICDQEVVRQANPQRGPMEMLNGIVHMDKANSRLIGFKDIRTDEFWVDCHIPGRPLFPGVLMIEAGAQLASFFTRHLLGWEGFIGFGGLDECRFRMQVAPPCRMYLLALKIWNRHQRVCCKVQGVVDGNLVFETTITGVQM